MNIYKILIWVYTRWRETEREREIDNHSNKDRHSASCPPTFLLPFLFKPLLDSLSHPRSSHHLLNCFIYATFLHCCHYWPISAWYPSCSSVPLIPTECHRHMWHVSPTQMCTVPETIIDLEQRCKTREMLAAGYTLGINGREPEKGRLRFPILSILTRCV